MPWLFLVRVSAVWRQVTVARRVGCVRSGALCHLVDGIDVEPQTGSPLGNPVRIAFSDDLRGAVLRGLSVNDRSRLMS